MAMLVQNCPHCGASKVAMPLRHAYANPTDTNHWWGMFMCSACQAASVATIESRFGADPGTFPGNLASANPNFRIRATYPAPPTPDVPAHLPDRVASLYRQAESVRFGQHWESAGMTQRKCLEAAIALIAPELKGTLMQRIDKLAEAHAITPAMKDWAHSLRLIGNEAAHDEAPEEQDITEAAVFLKLFLMYAFTLPEMVRQRREG